jgi:hypothetical protein
MMSGRKHPFLHIPRVAWTHWVWSDCAQWAGHWGKRSGSQEQSIESLLSDAQHVV